VPATTAPDEWSIVDELPRSSAGKICTFVLKEEAFA
jgi:acyl-coenzyme A synthetase/AMP-(fatty) acid ligase